MKRKFPVLVMSLLLLSWAAVNAQKTITNQSVVWYGYFLSFQFNEKWYLQTELQERHYINPAAQHQFLVRSHIHRLLGKSGWETSMGMCVFLQNPNDPEATEKITVPELRPHIELAYKQKLKHISLDHRYRAEARFYHNVNQSRTELEDGFDFGNFRFRYRFQATVPVWKMDEERALKIKVSDEIHVNAGNKIVKNVFDQNRIYAGISIDLLSNLTFDVGYLNWFQQRPTGDFFNRHILRFTVYHKINFQKNKNETK